MLIHNKMSLAAEHDVPGLCLFVRGGSIATAALGTSLLSVNIIINFACEGGKGGTKHAFYGTG